MNNWMCAGLLAKVPEKAMQGLQQTLNSPASPIYSPAFEELLRREARAPRSAYGGRSTSSARSNRSGNQGGGSMWSSLFGGEKDNAGDDAGDEVAMEACCAVIGHS